MKTESKFKFKIVLDSNTNRIQIMGIGPIII